LRSFQDTSPQARYFWHLGPTPANEKLPPPQSVGCGVYRGGINMLVIFFKTQDGGVPPPPLAVSQVFDKLFSFYRL
jgi:hypothetical protein